MGQHSLAVSLRDTTGKGVARKLRAAGRVPAVLYGRGSAPQSLSIDPAALEALIKGSEAGLNTLIDLEGGVTGKTVLIKELQREPVRGRLLHADLFEVDVEKVVVVSVRVHLTGTAVGVSLGGGLIDHAMRDVELECLPRAIPDEILLDVSQLDLGGSLHVRDIPLPEGVRLRSDGDLSVVSVVAPTVAETAEAGAEEGEVVEGADETKSDEGEAEGPG